MYAGRGVVEVGDQFGGPDDELVQVVGSGRALVAGAVKFGAELFSVLSAKVQPPTLLWAVASTSTRL